MAETASGSASASKYAPSPLRSASVKTAITGMKMNKATNTSAIVIRAILTVAADQQYRVFSATRWPFCTVRQPGGGYSTVAAR